MNLNRRTALALGASVTLVGVSANKNPLIEGRPSGERNFIGPTRAIVPVVGDGKWILNEPPEETGYFEPRTFDLSVEIQMRGTGNARSISAFTAAPVAFPEQQIVDLKIERQGCRAGVQQLTPESARLILQADSIQRGQFVSAAARYRLTIHKSHFGYDSSMFPQNQERTPNSKRYLGDSPGIKVSSRQVRKLVREVQGDLKHPWKIAKAFRQWVWDNIHGRYQDYTNVETALRKTRWRLRRESRSIRGTLSCVQYPCPPRLGS